MVKREPAANRDAPVSINSAALAGRAVLARLWPKRRISLNMCGVISLTLPIGSFARRRGVQPRQQIGQSTQVVVAKMGPTRADRDHRIVGHDIGPPDGKPDELSRVVVEVDAVLAPRRTAID
jgi:hypothetical protein